MQAGLDEAVACRGGPVERPDLSRSEPGDRPGQRRGPAGQRGVRPAPRHRHVRAERAGVQPLAELTGCGGVRRAHPGHQRGERVRMPGRGRVERGGDTGEGRIADAQRHQHVQQRGPVMVPADHGGQVAGWIEAAPLRRAHVAQHGGALPHVHQLQRVHVPARHHRVEHKPAHLARMGQREPLRDVGAVRDPVHGEPGDAERRPQRLDVGDRIRGGVEPPVRPDGRRARADRGGRGHRQVRCAHLPLQRRAVQCPRPGAALVEHHQPVAAQRCSKTVYEPRDERHARLAGTAGQEEEYAARGGRDVGHRDPQRQPPRPRAERIQPHA